MISESNDLLPYLPQRVAQCCAEQEWVLANVPRLGAWEAEKRQTTPPKPKPGLNGHLFRHDPRLAPQERARTWGTRQPSFRG